MHFVNSNLRLYQVTYNDTFLALLRRECIKVKNRFDFITTLNPVRNVQIRLFIWNTDRLGSFGVWMHFLMHLHCGHFG